VACTNQTCVMSGNTAACAGQCSPTQTNPGIACGNCGTNTQTCSASGTWADGTCTGQGCAPNATRSCNTYGTQTCSSSCAWGACSCALTPVCAPNTTQCSGGGVETCDACGQWGTSVTCPGNLCANGACCGSPQQTCCPSVTCGTNSNCGEGCLGCQYACNGVSPGSTCQCIYGDCSCP
jgi:hypothetical protein